MNLATERFTLFRPDVPGSSASISAGVSWFVTVLPMGKVGLLFVGTLDGLRHPTHLHEMLGERTIKQLVADREATFRGRHLRVVTEQDLKLNKKQRASRLACDGAALAMWPTLENLRLLAATLPAVHLGVVVWSYEKDVEPLFQTSDESPDEAHTPDC